jgi:hypothetical protein
MGIAKQIPTVEDKVRYLLQYYPQGRDNDRWLYFAYLRSFYPELRSANFNSFDDFCAAIVQNEDIPEMESIRRCRQKIQEAGEYQGTKRKERLEEAEKVRELINEAKY